MKRLLVLAAATAVSAGTGLGTAALAAPSQSGITHRNVRVCATPTTIGVAACNAIRHDTLRDGKPVSPGATGTPSGYGPSALHAAYNLPSTPTSGTPTIAIVDAYDLPTALNDVNVYRSQYGLGNPLVNGTSFRQVGQTGGPVPAVNASWGQEIALDIEMATAICNTCNILLVEATSASLSDLATAVNYAASQPGVVAISNSYGGSETSANSAYNQTAKGIAVTVSTGDSGYGVQSPASYPYVTAVGGTSLTSSGGTYSETAWSGAGSGCSRYTAQQPWQTGVVKNCSNRALADVSAVADPNTGVAVYDSTAYQGSVGWMVFGGTSVAAPIIGAVYALANNGGGTSMPYTHQSSLHDVTTGRNGHCNRTPALCTAGTGWDGPTGLGTPNGLGAF
ncbi:MAG TPA: S53 family peptidase [Mycobacteriales bacterium]|nr:S53 family peptidase [Mycobacteriales bacterium]